MAVDADPYPWPYDGSLDPTRLALVIAGAQEAWVARSVGATAVRARVADAAAAVRDAGGLVVHVRHGAPVGPPRPSGLPPGRREPSWALATDPEPDDLVVDAAGIDGFFGSPLDAELRARGIDALILAGFGAEAAVSSTLRSANDRGYECLTLSDAIAPFDAATGLRSLHTVTMSGGIFGAVATTPALVSALPSALPSRTPVEALS
ncbi:MAG: isochorismatase family cysteine hydrolase [Acidimicrobiales bacterium]